MKLTVSRLFDIALVATTDAYQQLQAFVENQLSFNDNVYRILLNNVTLSDNFAGQLVTVDLKHNVSTAIALNKVPSGVIVLKSFPLTPVVTAANFQANTSGTYDTIIFLSDPTYTQTVNVTLYYLF